MVNFADIQTNFWRLTGNTGTTSYGRCPGTQIRHADGHYGTQFLVDSLQVGILDFFAWSLDTSETGGGGAGLVLGINDMNLPNGGLFDICSNWQAGHTFHRIGASVDIDSRVELFDNRGTFVNLQPYQIRRLTRIMHQHGGVRFPEATIHYGFGGR